MRADQRRKRSEDSGVNQRTDDSNEQHHEHIAAEMETPKCPRGMHISLHTVLQFSMGNRGMDGPDAATFWVYRREFQPSSLKSHSNRRSAPSRYTLISTE